MRGRIRDISEHGNCTEMVNHSDIEDESEEENEEEDEEEEDDDNVPNVSHTSSELTDALTYMSKSDLDKLRGVSESANKIQTTSSSSSTSSSSESLSTLKITNSCTKSSGSIKKGKGKGKECEEVVTIESKEESTSTVSSSAYEHVTYMSIADLNALRGQVPDTSKKNVSDERVDGYAYESGGDDEEEEEEDEEEEESDDEEGDDDDDDDDEDQEDEGEVIHLQHSSRSDHCQGQGKRRKVSRCKRAGKRSRRDHDKLFSVALTTYDSSMTYDHAHGHGHDVAASNGISASLTTTGDCSVTYDHDHVVASNEVSAHCCDQHHGCSEDGCEDEEEIEEENEEDIRLRREEALDIQYEESDDKLWANIPAGELTIPSFLSSYLLFFLCYYLPLFLRFFLSCFPFHYIVVYSIHSSSYFMSYNSSLLYLYHQLQMKYSLLIVLRLVYSIS